MGSMEVSRIRGKRRRYAVSWIHATGRGKGARGVGPSWRETIAHRRWGRGMGKGFNDTVGRVRFPWGVSAAGLGEVRKDGINITRLSINKVIFQGYLKVIFLSLGKMGCNIFTDGR